jgi:hypothetical protein
MDTALVSAGFTTGSGASFVNLAILIALVAISWPLVQRFRRSVSENRKRRWVEEGLMDPPEAEPEPGEPPDQSR